MIAILVSLGGRYWAQAADVEGMSSSKCELALEVEALPLCYSQGKVEIPRSLSSGYRQVIRLLQVFGDQLCIKSLLVVIL